MRKKKRNKKGREREKDGEVAENERIRGKRNPRGDSSLSHTGDKCPTPLMTRLSQNDPFSFFSFSLVLHFVAH